jgi:hypothetical protein
MFSKYVGTNFQRGKNSAFRLSPWPQMLSSTNIWADFNTQSRRKETQMARSPSRQESFKHFWVLGHDAYFP